MKHALITLATVMVLFLGTSSAEETADQAQDGPALAASEGRIAVNGGSVYYRVVGGGDGIPAILLGGGPGAGNSYLDPLLASLVRDRPVITFDQLDSGRSDRPGDITLFTIDHHVAQVMRVAGELGVERFHLYGHSWGATLAFAYYFAHPEIVQSLTFAGPYLSGDIWTRDARRLIAEMPAEWRAILDPMLDIDGYTHPDLETAIELYDRRHFRRIDPPPKDDDADSPSSGQSVYNYMNGPNEINVSGTLKDFDATGRMGEIAVPTLFIVGRYDSATPEAAAYFQSLVQGAQLVVIEDASHMAMFEKPDEYGAAVRDFLARADD